MQILRHNCTILRLTCTVHDQAATCGPALKRRDDKDMDASAAGGRGKQTLKGDALLRPPALLSCSGRAQSC